MCSQDWGVLTRAKYIEENNSIEGRCKFRGGRYIFVDQDKAVYIYIYV